MPNGTIAATICQQKRDLSHVVVTAENVKTVTTMALGFMLLLYITYVECRQCSERDRYAIDVLPSDLPSRLQRHVHGREDGCACRSETYC